MNRNKVIVIGAGHNGLVCANYLARNGFDVYVFEQSVRAGGALVTEELSPGNFISTYAFFCYLLPPKIIEELDLKNYGFEAISVDPYRFHPFPDGTALFLWGNVEATKKSLKRFSVADAEGYSAWVDFWYRAAKLFYPYLFCPGVTINEIKERLATQEDVEFFDFILNASMTELVNKFFSHEKIRSTFIHSQDVGDPDEPGSIFANIYYRLSMLNHGENVGLIRGGAGVLASAFLQSAKASGVSFFMNSQVKKILIDQGVVKGVTLKDGSVFEADVIISNLDPKSTFLNLVEDKHVDFSFLEGIKKLKTTVGYGKFHAVLSGLPQVQSQFDCGANPECFGMIKICPSVDTYKASWKQAQVGEFPSEPILDVNIPSVYDDSLSEVGKHIMSAWISFFPVGERLAEGERERYVAKVILPQLELYFPGISGLVETWRLIIPADIEQSLGMYAGNIRHLDMRPDQMFENRSLKGCLPYMTPINYLYLCGAGTYPGGEITGIPGYNCAMRVIADLKEGG